MFKQISSKKWGWLLLFVIIFFVIIFYDNNSPKNKVIENPNFDAKVIEIKDAIILVEALNTQKEIIVGINHTNKSLSTGDLINIEYDGEIEESNPPSITALRIEKLDNRDLLY